MVKEDGSRIPSVRNQCTLVILSPSFFLSLLLHSLLLVVLAQFQVQSFSKRSRTVQIVSLTSFTQGLEQIGKQPEEIQEILKPKVSEKLKTNPPLAVSENRIVENLITKQQLQEIKQQEKISTQNATPLSSISVNSILEDILAQPMSEAQESLEEPAVIATSTLANSPDAQEGQNALSSELSSILSEIAPPRAKMNQERVTQLKKTPLVMLVPATMPNADRETYLSNLRSYLAQRWKIPVAIQNQNLHVQILFRVEKNGRILHANIEKLSENRILNHSVKQLLAELQFLPKLPETYPLDEYEFGIQFTIK